MDAVPLTFMIPKDRQATYRLETCFDNPFDLLIISGLGSW